MYAILLLCATAVTLDDPEPATKSPPPILLMASIKNGHLFFRVTQTVVVPVTTIEKVNKNGKVEDVTITKLTAQIVAFDQAHDLSKATLSTAGGKKLTPDDVKKRLEKPGLIVLSSDGRAVDAEYLKAFDKDALVIVVPMPRFDPKDLVPSRVPIPV